ncbi:unnamed protein product [Chrysoparadoxa australica]
MELPDYEADDVIATLAVQATTMGCKRVLVMAADKDMAQLVAPNVYLFDAYKEKLIGPEEVEERWGVPPHLFVDLQGLMGDRSDNLPGVPGIGKATGAKLLQEYGSLDEVLANIDNMKPSKRRESLRDNRDAAIITRKLAYLVNDAPLPKQLEEVQPYSFSDSQAQELLAFLKKNDLKALERRTRSLFTRLHKI